MPRGDTINTKEFSVSVVEQNDTYTNHYSKFWLVINDKRITELDAATTEQVLLQVLPSCKIRYILDEKEEHCIPRVSSFMSHTEYSRSYETEADVLEHLAKMLNFKAKRIQRDALEEATRLERKAQRILEGLLETSVTEVSE